MEQASSLDSSWVDTLDEFSLLKLNKIVIADAKEAKAVKAKTSELFKIYKKNFAAGSIIIPLKSVRPKSLSPGEVPKTSKQLLFFFQLNIFAGEPTSCGGKEELISLSTGTHFKSCIASTEYSENYGCKYAFANIMEDREKANWATLNEGVGSFIEVKLLNDYQITKIEYRNRNNQVERNKDLVTIKTWLLF